MTRRRPEGPPARPPPPPPELTPAPAEVARRVVTHFRRTRRDLPWRRRRPDPYAVWVSEVMLQQTRVAAVVPYFERWLARFPTVEALAAAPLDDVLAQWSGLGYYRRARDLHRGAREVVERFAGRLPDDAAGLRALPGVGRYTAGAVASIAFGRREPVVDGNVARVLARLYEVEGEIQSARATRALWALAAALVPADRPGDFNQGLMELGATICTPARPACRSCPLEDLCRARARGRVGELPRTRPRKAAEDKPELSLVAAWIARRGRLLLARRPASGLYGGLWELPQAPTRAALVSGFGGALALEPGAILEERAELSHRRLLITLVCGLLEDGVAAPAPVGYERAAWHPLSRIERLGLSSPTRAIIARTRSEEIWTRTKKPSACLSRAISRSSKG